jgi:catechol 2,3-dioxygenase-like lactoylglutathione lyase family enzyme
MPARFGPVVPILRMFDLPATLRFYRDYLGCTVDWQDGELRERGYPFLNPAVEGHDRGREMTLIDPASNRLRFFERR